MPPFLGGGHMIANVTVEEIRFGTLPAKFEAGTLQVAEGIGLGAAIDFLAELGMDKVRAHEKEICAYALERLQEVPGLNIMGPLDAERRGALVAFTIEDIHPHDVADILGSRGVCVRAGHHCAQPLMRRFDVAATTRASFAVHTTRDNVDALLDGINETPEDLRMTGLDNVYREDILALHKSPRNWGRLDPHDLSFEDSNGLCGDALRVEIRLDATKRVDVVRFSGDGCAISRASASMASDYVVGMSVDDLLKIESKDILQLLGVEVTDERLPCALLPLRALHGAVLGGADAVDAKVRPAKPVVVLCATERWIPPTEAVAPRLALVAAQIADPECHKGC